MESDPDGIKIEPLNEQFAGHSLLSLESSSVITIQQSAVTIPDSSSLASLSPYRSLTPDSFTGKQRWNESREARERRLERNAERMRDRRSRESDEDYRNRLARNAEANRMRRQNESEMERAMRLVRNAARQRLRRAMESPEQRSKRLSKLAERMRLYRATEPAAQRKIRLAEMAARARQRIANESPEERKERLRKLNEYAKRVREKRKRLKQPTGLTNESTSNQNRSDHIEQNYETSCNNSQTQEIHQSYPHPTLAKSMEYYQNMFLSQSLKQQQIQQHEQDVTDIRFGLTNITSLNQAQSTVFPQNVYENQKNIYNKSTQHGTIVSSIEYYQNKFIKSEQQQSETQDEKVLQSDQNDDRSKKTETHFHASHQQIQNNPNVMYNQIAYLPPFPSTSNPNSSAALSPNTQQTYYPMYHNGFQIGITPNSAPPPFTPVHFQPASSLSHSQTNSYNFSSNSTFTQTQQLIQDFPKPIRGRPKKVFQECNMSATGLQDELLKERNTDLLEDEFDEMLASPKIRRRGQGQETEADRKMRLNKMATHQRNVRANESAEQRAARLKSLSERAKQQRAEIRKNETEEERTQRLAKQAQYARLRRLKAQTPENKRKVEEKAKKLYAQLHNVTVENTVEQQQLLLVEHHQHHPHESIIGIHEDVAPNGIHFV